VRGDQLARQWRMIQRLARSRSGAPVGELARELECTRRTIYRDLDALQFAGFPVTSEKRGGRVFYKLLDSFQLGDAPFTPDELLALAFGEELLKNLAGTVFHESVRSALAKVRASLGPELGGFLGRLRESFQVVPGPHKRYAELEDVIRAINEAVLERRSLRMEYTTGRSGRKSRRDFDPYRVWYQSGALYAIGYDHQSGQIRTFAVDRIRAPQLLAANFIIPGDFDFEAHSAGAFGVVAEQPESVRIRFAKRRALYIRERIWHPSQEISETPDGGVELALRVGTGDELRGWLLSFGADAWVIEPDHLRGELRAELERARACYD